MALRLIMGNSGSGKSHRLYQELAEASVKEPNQRFLMIVPEQYSLQAQRELIQRHPRKGLFNIEVLSFQRLAYRVFEEVGAEQRVILEEAGKNLLLRKVATEEKGRLKTLGSSLHKPGYLAQVKSLISELVQYDVTQERMEKLLACAKKKPRLYYKLQDVALLQEGFYKRLEKTYITAEEVLGALEQVAADSLLLRGSVIGVDGFVGFTPQQLKLLRTLFALARQVTVTIPVDVKEDPWNPKGKHRLFYPAQKTLQTLTTLAKESRIQIEEPVLLNKTPSPRFSKAPALNFLERHLLRFDGKIYEGKQEEISLFVCKNPVEEAHFAARTIVKLVRESGYRYRDAALITGDITVYGEYVRRVFADYGIPVFVDATRPVLLNPMLELIRAALEALNQDFRYAGMFRYLRTGLAGADRDEIDLLENYVLAAGIRGRARWNQEWEQTTKTFEAQEVSRCNEIRKKVMEPLEQFASKVRGRGKKTARELTEALYDLLASLRIQEQMEAYRAAFVASGELERAREYGQIYGIVIGLLDKVVELLGEEQVNLREFTEILEAGFEEVRVGNIPPTADQVLVGDLERTRLKDVKALFFLGLNDGWVPKHAGSGGILTDQDREELSASNIELAPTARENAYQQRFYLYLNLTKPSERLYLSYSRSNMNGEAMRPSYLMNSIRKLFPHLEIREEEGLSWQERVCTPKNGWTCLMEGIRELPDEEPEDWWKELYSWYYEREAYRERVCSLVRAAFLKRTEKGLGSTVAQALYGKTLVNSVSRLERFAACAFAHFLRYGLNLKEREEYQFRPVDFGNVLHLVMELFSKRVEAGPYTWADIPQETAEEWADACVEQVAEEYGLRILQSTARNQHAVRRMKRLMRRTVWALCSQVRAGSFVPSNYEVSFSVAEDLEAVNIALTEKEKMRLRGRIDRIDICEKEDQVYVKVIDYKSGNTEFDIAALYYGLQLQLVVYLNAAMELEGRIFPDKEIVPGGILYYRISDPMLDREEISPEEVNRQILRKLKPSGLVNADREVVEALDRDADRDSDVIPVSYNKDGKPSKYASVASKEQFASLSSFVHQKMQSLGREILQGECSVLPYERKGRRPCEYCEFREVCGFDPKIPGTRVRRLTEYKPEEIWRMIQEETGQ